MTAGGLSIPVDAPDRRAAFAAHIYSPAHLIARADQIVNAGYLERCRSGGLQLTLPQLLYLCAVSANPGGHQAAAARMVGMDTPTGALVISALERKGFVERRESEADKRRKKVYITEKGGIAQARGIVHFASATHDFMAPISPADRLRLRAILEIIAAHRGASPPSLCNADGESVVVPAHLPPEVLPGYLLGRCLQIAVALVAPALAPFDLTIRQYVMLAMVSILGPCNLASLTHAMGSERSSLAIILPALEERGLVNVDRGPDRSLTIMLTQNGRALLARARPAAETANERVAINLTGAERKTFTRTLGGMLERHGKFPWIENITSGSSAAQPAELPPDENTKPAEN